MEDRFPTGNSEKAPTTNESDGKIKGADNRLIDHDTTHKRPSGMEPEISVEDGDGKKLYSIHTALGLDSLKQNPNSKQRP
jgi:hypothetical protein